MMENLVILLNMDFYILNFFFKSN